MHTYCCWQEVCRNETLKLETEAKAALEEAASDMNSSGGTWWDVANPL